jgi:hypothetical protein
MSAPKGILSPFGGSGICDPLKCELQTGERNGCSKSIDLLRMEPDPGRSGRHSKLSRIGFRRSLRADGCSTQDLKNYRILLASTKASAASWTIS